MLTGGRRKRLEVSRTFVDLQEARCKEAPNADEHSITWLKGELSIDVIEKVKRFGGGRAKASRRDERYGKQTPAVRGSADRTHALLYMVNDVASTPTAWPRLDRNATGPTRRVFSEVSIGNGSSWVVCS